MSNNDQSTGYGPRMAAGRYARLIFDGDETKYESWEVKFLGYMRLLKLRDTILRHLVPMSMQIKTLKFLLN